MRDMATARRMVNSLRHGTPPEHGVSLYSVGNEDLIQGVKTHHLDQIGEQGKIRFLSGSWGSGKTHFFRLLREAAFDSQCLVSNVELSVDEAPFNKFEMVFHSIVRNIQTPSHYRSETVKEVAPFGRVLEEALSNLATGNPSPLGRINDQQYSIARAKLMANGAIDIDFKKIVDQYWSTFFAERVHESRRDEMRGELLQWFAGEGNLRTFRSKFGINKMVSRESAKVLLQSLAGFVRLAGYKGLLILFDEAEQSYSVMKKADLKEAHNNLLSIINNIGHSSGLFMIYATTPDFFDEPQYGIVKYPPLATRIGMPRDQPPIAPQNVWNFDAVQRDEDDYEMAAMRLRSIYIEAYPEPKLEYPAENQIRDFVKAMKERQSENEGVRFWRIMVAALMAHMDDHFAGHLRSPEVIREDTMLMLRE
jgi:hypothetical protein